MNLKSDCMNSLAEVLLLIGLILAKCDVGASEEVESGGEHKHDPKVEKEKNYKKFIGETIYHVPFRTRLAQPLREGQTIHAVGTLSADPKRVDFNFQKGIEKNADLPLHFSIRFDEGVFSGKLVYNTFENGAWSDNEQRIKNPFKANSEFDLRIRIINGKYQVFANRVEVGTFDQHIPVDGVDTVTITGDLAELRLFHYGGQVFTIPYNAIAKLTPGMRFDAALLPTGKRFNINFYRRDHQYALQISVRFGEGVIVRNAMNNHTWGNEEREGGMPISKGEMVDVTVINEQYSFQIFLNGNRFATFAHRDSPDDVETVEIDGDVEIFSVTINKAVGV